MSPLGVAPQPEIPPSRGSWIMRLRERDHTRGSVLSSLLVLSIPAILTGLVGFGIFQLIELRFLSQLGETQIAAAGATNRTLRQLVFMIVIGVTISCQMLVARSVGQGQLDTAARVSGQTCLLGLGIAALAIATGGLFPEFFVSLVTRDPDVAAQCIPYVRVTFLTWGAIAAVPMINSMLNGAGDATTPLIVMVIMTPLSILAEWALAFGKLGMPALGIAGIGLGAAVGSLFGAGIALWALLSGRCRVHLRAEHFAPDVQILGQLIAKSWQPTLHLLARSAMIVVFMGLAGQLSGHAQAAYTIGLRVELLAIMVAYPLANSCATLVSQNLGAGDVPRAWRAIWVTSGVEMLVLGPTSVVLYLFRHEIVAFFAQEPEVAQIAGEYLAYASMILVFQGVYYVASRTMQAAGDMISPMLLALATTFLVGAPLGFYLAFESGLGARGLWIANLVYTIVNALLMLGWMLTGRWAR